jgi:hypothetical protein
VKQQFVLQILNFFGAEIEAPTIIYGDIVCVIFIFQHQAEQGM